MVGLAGYGARLPAQLSGGQQQRVALARVLATDPRVLLFDEPLSALDKNLRDTLKYSILDLQRRTGKTAIYVTHDQSEAFAISDRIVVMNAGRIEQIGTQTDIYLHPADAVRGRVHRRQQRPARDVTGPSRRGRRRAAGSSMRTGARSRCRADRPGLAVGESVVAYVRPEDIEVLDGRRVDGFANVIEGTIDRVIFEGPTAQLRVDVGGRELRVDVTGDERLTLMRRDGRIRLGFDEVTVIPAPA